jgi:ABC-type polysaccharide/polyol phosphate export permease
MATLEYDSDRRVAPIVSEFVELVRYRDLLGMLVNASIKTRYKRSTLGVVWTLVNPMLTMLVLAFAFSHIMKVSVPNYPVYVLSGLIFWNFFTQTTTSSMNSLIWGGSLIKRVYVPRTIFAVAATGNGLVNLGLAFIPLVFIMLVTRQSFSPTLWFLPIALLLLTIFTLGVALLMSAIAVFFVDVVDMYQIFVASVFYLTPVMYPPSILPPGYVWYLNLNPIYHLLEAFRRPIIFGVLPGPKTIAAATVSAFVALALGWWAFTRKADQLAYRL